MCKDIMYICTYFCAATDTHYMIHIEKSVSRTKNQTCTYKIREAMLYSIVS